MGEEAVFSIKLDAELRDAFMAEADAAERPASQIVTELIRDFVKARTEQRSYDEFVRRKVEIARAQIAEGRTFSQEEVEAEVAARREKFLQMAKEADA